MRRLTPPSKRTTPINHTRTHTSAGERKKSATDNTALMVEQRWGKRWEVGRTWRTPARCTLRCPVRWLSAGSPRHCSAAGRRASPREDVPIERAASVANERGRTGIDEQWVTAPLHGRLLAEGECAKGRCKKLSRECSGVGRTGGAGAHPVPGGHHSDGAVVAVIGTLARLSRHIRLPEQRAPTSTAANGSPRNPSPPHSLRAVQTWMTAEGGGEARRAHRWCSLENT
jgi:hypothetical protein